MTKIVDISTTLSERGSRYGKFTGHAKITQDIKSKEAEDVFNILIS